MFKFFFILLCLLHNTQGNIFNVGDSYNITWNNADTDYINIVLETNINNSWNITLENEYKYLSTVVDNQPNYFIWVIPSGLANYWMYDHRILIINSENNSNIKNDTFNIRKPEIELITSNQNITNSPIITTTIKTSNIGKEETDEKKEICIEGLCIPLYGFLIIIAVIIVLLCLCCCCYC